MPIGGRISTSPVSEKDVLNYRRWFFVGWVLLIGVAPWFLWWNPGAKPELQFQVLSIPTLVILTLVSFPLGWILGYKFLFAPLFIGKILIGEPKT